VTCDSGSIEVACPITADEPYLAGHYPAFPVLPGVFLIEVAVDAVRELLHRRDGTAAWLTGAPSVRFHKPLHPGDTLRVRCELATADGPASGDGSEQAVRAICRNGHDLAARFDLVFGVAAAGSAAGHEACHA
jgi:3-hydroxyacyl-[acyl-carrier-protein] dehydratase